MDGKSKYKCFKIILYVIAIIKQVFFIPKGVCRYSPSCTLYAVEAINKLPLHNAILKIIIRLLKCNPLSKGGYDPVV